MVVRVPILAVVVQEAARGAHSGGGSSARLAPQPAGLERARALVRALDLVLNGAANFEGADGRPDGALAAEDPVVECLARRGLEEAEEVAGRDLGD